MSTIFHQLHHFLTQGETVALATIISTKGSVPREVGAQMLVHPLGQHVGTVGGGCGEADVIRVALDVLQTGTPEIVRVDLTDDVSMQSLGVCGGVMSVFVERWTAEKTLPLLKTLLEAIDAQRSVALATVVAANDASRLGERFLVWPDGTTSFGTLETRAAARVSDALASGTHGLIEETPEVEFFVTVQRQPPDLVIVGAGHVAQPLATMGALCGFQVTVLDDRPQFANCARFPHASDVLAAPLQETVRAMLANGRLGRDAYLVLVTRGHQHDVACLLEVIDAPLAYVGMIGSQRRINAVFQLLREERGISPEKFDRIYAPIGLDIGARTPAEIAVCVMAEIIHVRNGGTARPLSNARRQRDQERRERLQTRKTSFS